MAKNITLSVDEKILKKAKKVAVDKNTTVSAIVRKHLESIAEQDDNQRQIAIIELEAIFKKSNIRIGNKKWGREDLHER